MATITRERTQEGVTERLFEIEVKGERVPGVVWTREGASGARPLILMGHGGTQHKRVQSLAQRAARYALKWDYAVAAIDAPMHGARISEAERARISAELDGGNGRLRGNFSEDRLKEMAVRNKQAVPEWIATLDWLKTLPEIGDGPIGYWGVSMGTAIGVPFLAEEKRVKCAVLGLLGLRGGIGFGDAMKEAASKISIPLEFVFQWDDEVATREGGVGLYEAFASKDKSMHINPGPHMGIPPQEAASWEAFYHRHLGLGPGAER